MDASSRDTVPASGFQIPECLFKQIAIIKAGGARRFCAEDFIRKANIGLVCAGFKRIFLRRIEGNIKKTDLIVYCLEKASSDDSILDKLKERAEINLAHLFFLLKKQSNGNKEGPLAVNGCTNVAYVRDAENNLCVVSANWNVDCFFWEIEAELIGTPGLLAIGDQIISRVG